MKILIINDSDSSGGAARAAYRLFESLNIDENVECYMLVRHKSKNESRIITTDNKYLDILRPKLNNIFKKIYFRRSKTLFSSAFIPNVSLVNIINSIDPDIVHLHWVNNGFLTVKALAEINRPIIWSLHDEWAFTGGCHYDENCNNYQDSCGNCKVLASRNKYDFSYFSHKEKRKYYSEINKLYINGLSHWIMEKAKKSSVFSEEVKFINLPNPIDVSIFKPYDNNNISELTILVGAASKKDDPRKGFDLLLTALKMFTEQNVVINVIGNEFCTLGLPKNIKVNKLGNVSDDLLLAKIYSDSDLTIVPSRQENLSNMIMESLSCGTPVVAFDIGGNKDMIEHFHNGYLANAYDCLDLFQGINWVYENKLQLSLNSRNKVVNNYSYSLISSKYISLYYDVLSEA